MSDCEKHNWWHKDDPCPICIEDKEKLKKIEDIESRFYSWRLHEQQEVDFAWLVKTLKEELNGSN